ncbi:MAG: aspartate/glutamate racemase family protein [Thermoplasmata archaeon]
MQQNNRKILWINPIGVNSFDKPMLEYLNTVKDEKTVLDVVSFEKGPYHLEYHFYEALVSRDILRTVKMAEKKGYDAAVIGCFYDPFLFEAREITQIVVTAPAESSLLTAISLGYKFSILVGRKKWIPQMEENVIKYGFKDRLASFKSIDMGVLEFQKKKSETEKRLLQAGRDAVEKDGAEVLIMGCTAEFGFYKRLQDELKVPVIDATIAPLKYAEYLIDLKKSVGLVHSKIGRYESPPYDEIRDWKIEEKFDIEW